MGGRLPLPMSKLVEVFKVWKIKSEFNIVSLNNRKVRLEEPQKSSLR